MAPPQSESPGTESDGRGPAKAADGVDAAPAGSANVGVAPGELKPSGVGWKTYRTDRSIGPPVVRTENPRLDSRSVTSTTLLTPNRRRRRRPQIPNRTAHPVFVNRASYPRVRAITLDAPIVP